MAADGVDYQARSFLGPCQEATATEEDAHDQLVGPTNIGDSGDDSG